jgi:hypothetical protein
VRLLLALAILGALEAAPAPGGWRVLAHERSVSPPGPPGLTAVTAEASVPVGPATANLRSLRIRVRAEPASLRPYVSYRVACRPGHVSFAGNGYHRASFTKTFSSTPGCAADVTATLYFWAGASGVSVWIDGR